MLGIIKHKAKLIGRNLTNLDSQPIGKAALTVVIFLDLFILISIFDGLTEHTRQLTTPDEYIPQHCRDIVIDGEWNNTNQLVRIAQVISTYRRSYVRHDERSRLINKHPTCEPIMRLMYTMEDDKQLSKNLSDFLLLRQQIIQTQSELEHIRAGYDTALLESIAKPDNVSPSTEALRKEIAEKTELINGLVKKRQLLQSSLEQNEHLKQFFSVINAVSEASRNDLLEDLRHLNFWYPLKRLGMEMLFLLPLFVALYFWNTKSIHSNRPFQTLVSSHLLVVVFIPVLFKIAELVYDIIPKKLLEQLVELLESLHLVALWHYLLMVIAILTALVLIYVFQKKLFSHEKLIKKRISKGLCQSCGIRLPEASPVCPLCGFNQYKECCHCNKPTYVYGKYCKECGHGQ